MTVEFVVVRRGERQTFKFKLEQIEGDKGDHLNIDSPIVIARLAE